MRDIVISNKNKYIHKGKIYDDISIKKIINKEVNLYIIEENLLIKSYDGIKSVKENVICDIINDEYGVNHNVLMHYEYDKKRKKLFLYSIGDVERIQFLCGGLSEVTILPIQFYIREITMKKIKKPSQYRVLTKIKDHIYYLEITNNLITKSIVDNKENFVKNFNYKDINEGKTFVIDKNIDNELMEQFKEKRTFIRLNIGDKINEKIFEV